MTPDEFCSLIRDLAPGALPRPVLETVQFRVGAKPFATVGWPAAGWAVVKVEPGRQSFVLSLSPALAPEPGRRRKAGIVLARLAALDVEAATALVAEALSMATRAERRTARPVANGARPERPAPVPSAL